VQSTRILSHSADTHHLAHREKITHGFFPTCRKE
jgi:hypothetical protein